MLVELSVMEQRYDAVMEVLRDCRPVVEVAARFGVSRQSVHRWIARYREGGVAALADRSHRPASCPHQTPAAVEARVCELRRLHPGWGPLRILHRLGKEGVEPLPSRSAVYRALVRNRLVEPAARRRRKKDYRRWERDRPMELWQMDVVGGIFLEDGTELKAVTAVDDHSRFCVSAALVRRATARAVCDAFAAAMRRHGVPEEILTDNGNVFTGRLGPRPTEVLFDRICRENGIKHRLTAVRSPTTTGKIERFHLTLRRDFLAGRTLAGMAEAQAALDAWVEDYNRDRPHQSLGMAPPAERFEAGAEGAPAEVIAAPGPGADLRGWPAVERVVSSSGFVRVADQRFSVGRHLAARVVTVYVGDDLLHVYADGRCARTVMRETRGPVRVRNARADGLRAADAAAVKAAAARAAVVRRVSAGGNARVAGQRVHVGRSFAGELVAVDVGDDVLRVYLDAALIKAVARTSRGPVRNRNPRSDGREAG